MAKLILILGDQLSPALASLRQWQSGDVVLLAEVQAEAEAAAEAVAAADKRIAVPLTMLTIVVPDGIPVPVTV